MQDSSIFTTRRSLNLIVQLYYLSYTSELFLAVPLVQVYGTADQPREASIL